MHNIISPYVNSSLQQHGIRMASNPYYSRNLSNYNDEDPVNPFDRTVEIRRDAFLDGLLETYFTAVTVNRYSSPTDWTSPRTFSTYPTYPPSLNNSRFRHIPSESELFASTATFISHIGGFGFIIFLQTFFYLLWKFLVNLPTILRLIHFVCTHTNHIPTPFPRVIPIWPFVMSFDDTFLFPIHTYMPYQDDDTNHDDNESDPADTSPFDTIYGQAPTPIHGSSSNNRESFDDLPNLIPLGRNPIRFFSSFSVPRLSLFRDPHSTPRINTVSSSDSSSEYESASDYESELSDFSDDFLRGARNRSRRRRVPSSPKPHRCALCGMRAHNIRSCNHPAIKACIALMKRNYSNGATPIASPPVELEDSDAESPAEQNPIPSPEGTSFLAQGEGNAGDKVPCTPMLKAILLRLTNNFCINANYKNLEEWTTTVDIHALTAPSAKLVARAKPLEMRHAVHVLFDKLTYAIHPELPIHPEFSADDFHMLEELETQNQNQSQRHPEFFPTHIFMPRTILNSHIPSTDLSVTRQIFRAVLTINTAKILYAATLHAFTDTPCTSFACPICTESRPLHTAIVTECNHLFCATCIATLIAKRRNSQTNGIPCPMCRANSDTFHTHSKLPDSDLAAVQKAIHFSTCPSD
jgi:hypothetical protein